MNRLCLAFACIFIQTGMLRGAAQGSPTSQSVYALLSAQDYTRAEATARQLLVDKPRDCGLNTMLALAVRGQGRDATAYEALQHTLSFCSHFVPALESASELAYGLHLPTAPLLLTQLLELQPQNATAHAMLGAVRAQSGDCAGAVDQYDRAAEQVRQNPVALREYARCLITLDRGKDALPLLQRLVAIRDTPVNRESLTQVQWKLGNPQAAFATLQPLLGDGSTEAPAMLLAAQITEAGNRTPEAIAWLRKAIAADPFHVQSYLYFAEVSFTHGSFQVGVDFLDLGLRRCGPNARLLLARGVLEAQLARIDPALIDFKQAHLLDPKLSLTGDAEGVLFSQSHDLSSALALFREKADAQPNDPLLQYLYAEALSQTADNADGQLVQAISALRRSVQLEPTYQPARDLLCVLLLRQGDFLAVVDEARKAIQLNSYDEVALYQALQAERRLKHPDETTAYVRMLQDAKTHNQIAVTRYALEER